MKTIEDKINYLRKLARLYVRFFKHYKKSRVELNGETVLIEYYERKTPTAYYFKREEFPVEDINKIIISTRQKIDREYKKRSQNKYLNE